MLQMGLLVSKLWKFWFSQIEYKIIIVGLDNAGKTTILYQLATGEAVHTSPTIGSNVEEVTWRNLHFIVWDIGGQESLRNSWSSYYAHSHFLIVVIDSTDIFRLDIIKQQLFRILAHEDLAKAAVLIYANKQDLKGSMTAAQISAELNLSSVKSHVWQIQACCALTGEGIDKGLEWIASNIS